MFSYNFFSTVLKRQNSKFDHIINNIFFYFILLHSIQSVYSKNSYRVDHHINVLGETEWETVPIKLNGKSRFNSLYSNVKSIYNKAIKNPYNKYMSTGHHEYETADTVEGKVVDNINEGLKGINAFHIDFNCKIRNTEICKKAETNFNKAGKILLKMFNIS